MKQWIASVIAMLSTSAPLPAQELSYGEIEYLNSCAVCHGPEGKGDGPLVEELMKTPTNLTELTQQNRGEFPYWRVYSMIDGRYVVPGHGDREMPVWGQQFLDGDAPIYGPIGGPAVTTERIHQLTEYVRSLQR
jgi:mono/diheme cytochrome c family protein